MPSFSNPVFAAHAADAPGAEDGASLLKPVSPERRVTVRFTDIDAFVQVLVTPGAAGQPAAAAPQQPKDKAQGPPQDHDLEAGHQHKQPEPAAQAKNKERQILFKITGTAEPGQMLALMGPSGSGKSSLLTVLGGRNRARITGTLRFNEHPLNKAMKRRMGFVTQDDLLYAELTTFETLFYAALLRLPKTWTRTQKLERVEMVLRGLGLDKARDTIIGNHMMRGVSGGERKRVSIGHELLINPSVILLDEPTSGLDSTTALKLIQTLRALATGGRTIIASIHQPSSRLYQEFDKLMLLSEGYAIYYGDAQASAHWFALQGVPVPFGVSMPDHLLDLACGDLTGSTPRDVASTLQQRLVAAFAERTFGLGDDGVQPGDFGTAAPGIAVDDGHGVSPRPRDDSDSGASSVRQRALGLPIDSSTTAVTTHTDGASSSSPTELSGVVAVVKPQQPQPQQQQQQRGSTSGSAPKSGAAAAPSSVGDDDDDDEDDEDEEDGGQQLAEQRREEQRRAAAAAGARPRKAQHAEGRWGASFPQQIMILMSRCLRVRRFQSLTVQRFVEVILVALLAGLFWFQVSGPKGTQLTDQAISNIQGLLFFQLLFTSFSSLFSALFTFPADFAILVKERQSGMYRLSAYYLARTATEIPIDCLVPTIMTIIIYFMGGLRLSAGAFFCNWATMLLTMLVAQSIGLLLSASISEQKTLLSVTTVFMLATMLIAGFYVQNTPVWIDWAKWLSFIRYGYILLQQIEFTGRGMDCGDYYRDNPTAPQGLTWCPITGSPTIPSEVGESVATQVCVLFAFLIAVRIGVYVSLARRTTFKVKAL